MVVCSFYPDLLSCFQCETKVGKKKRKRDGNTNSSHELYGFASKKEIPLGYELFYRGTMFEISLIRFPRSMKEYWPSSVVQLHTHLIVSIAMFFAREP
jgi:hypothetical protein